MIDTAKNTDVDAPKSGGSSNPRSLFESLLNKLSFICDSKRGEGATTTSFVVLCDQSTSGVEYLFASNRRTPKELETTTHYVFSIIENVNNALLRSTTQGGIEEEARNSILREILLFNRQKITVFVNSLKSEAQDCLQSHNINADVKRKFLSFCYQYLHF